MIMTKIIGVSGAHGTGKSVAIDKVKELNSKDPYIIVDDFKVSRTVLAELGMTLEEATANAEVTKIYQTMVLRKKIHRDGFSLKLNYPHLQHNPLERHFLVDRSVADIYAYTKLWTEKNNIEEKWFTEFEERCIAGMSAYDMILLFPIGVFAFVDDGIRAKEDTQAKHQAYTQEFIEKHAKSYKIIDAVSIEDRAHQIIQIIKNGTETSPNPRSSD